MRCPTCLRDLDPQNTDLVGFAQESWNSDLSPLSGNIMDDQQQRRFRAAYSYYSRWYCRRRVEIRQQRQQCYQARRKEFRASVQQQFALIRAKFQAVESVLQEVLSAQADPSTAWMSSWPSSTVTPHLSRSPTATSSANVACCEMSSWAGSDNTW